MGISWLTLLIGAGVFLMWMVCVGVQVASRHDPHPFVTPLEVHGLMGTVVGALYTHDRVRRGRPAPDRENA